MSDVPIGPTPDPQSESYTGQRNEVMGAIGSAASGIGRVMGSAVAGIGSARSSVSDVLNSTAEGVKTLGKQVDDFVTRRGKQFADTMERAAAALEKARSASEGLGGSLGTTGSGMMDWGKEARAQTEKAHKSSTGGRAADHDVMAAPLSASSTGGQATPRPNGGESAGKGTPGYSDVTINAQSVTVNGGSGAGGGTGRGEAAGEGEEGNGNGGDVGFLGRSLRFGGLLAAGAGIRAAGNLYGETRQELRPQQTAFQRVGFGRSISQQQAGMRDYHAMGVSEFSSEDLTGALNVGGSYLGGTNFRMTSLAPLQQASLDMSATQAAQVAQSVGTAATRNRLYQYGISTRGLSPDERLMEAARFALQKRGGGDLTTDDFNKLSTQGGVEFANLSHLLGGDQAAMQAARDLVGQEAGVTGLGAANATLRSEVEKDVARRELTNEMLEEIAGVAQAQNKTLEGIYGAVKGFPDWSQSVIASLGALAGPAQGALGSLGGGLLGGVGGAGAAATVKGALSAGSAKTANVIRKVPGGGRALSLGGRVASKAALPLAGLAALWEQGSAAWSAYRTEGGALNPDRIRDVSGWRERAQLGLDQARVNILSPLNMGFQFGDTDWTLGALAEGVLDGDEGDPPEGSNIRTNKPVDHVTGLQSSFRAALERMFRDNPRLHLTSGYRSVEHQERLWKKALREHGSAEKARKWVAPPGKSNHNRGLAADIGPSSEYAWIKRNAPKYGLTVPLSNEDWHVEPAGLRSGKEMVDINIESGGSESTSKRDSAGQPKADFKGSFRLGGVTSSEGDTFASLIGSGGLTGGVSGGPSTADVSMLNSAESGGGGGSTAVGSFSGSMAERAEAVARVAKEEGFAGSALTTMVAIALGESSGNPRAHNSDASTGDNSYGLWQINMLGNLGPSRREWFGIKSNEELFDPAVNARAARMLQQSRGNFEDWSVYKDNSYKQYLDEARAGVSAVGDPPTKTGVDGPSTGGSVVMKGGNKTVQMFITGQQDPRALAERVKTILNEEEEFEMVGVS